MDASTQEYAFTQEGIEAESGVVIMPMKHYKCLLYILRTYDAYEADKLTQDEFAIVVISQIQKLSSD